MITTSPTRPTLLSIDATGPLRFRELGKGNEGIDWIVEPGEPMERAIAMVNQYGGPNAWSITDPRTEVLDLDAETLTEVNS